MRCRVFVLLWILAVVDARAEFRASDWKFWVPLDLPEQMTRDIALVRLDLSGTILAEADIRLHDLRVLDDREVEIPYVLVVDSSSSRQEIQPVRILNLSVLPDEYQQVICDLGEDSGISNLIRIRTEANGYFRRVDILGSSDAENWLELRSGARIFDNYEQLQYRNLQVSYPDSNYRFLKVLVWLDGQPPIPLDGIEVIRLRRVEVARERLTARLTGREENPERRATEYTLGIGLPRQHLSVCRLAVRQSNFRRLVEISVQREDGRWETVGSSWIQRFSSGDWVEEQLEVPLNDLNHSNARLRVFNEDNPALDVTSVVLERNPHALILEVIRGGKYRLFFGNGQAQQPSYDLGELANRSLDLRALPRLVVGALTENAEFREPRQVPPWTDRHPLILWAGLALGVAALVWMLRRALAEMGAPGDE